MNLITGSTGLVGTCLLEKHVSDGIPVRALIRKESDKDKFKFDTSKVDWVIGDVLDVVALSNALSGVEYVFHCAAIVSYGGKMEAHMHKVNIEGTANVVNRCLLQNVKKLCHLSSVAALGEGTEQKPLNELNYFDESKEHSSYGYSKYYSELEVWRGIEEGLSAVILNPTIILGPGDWNRSSSKLFKYVWDEHKFYIGGGYNFIDVRDLVQQMFAITYSDTENNSFVITGHTVSYKDVFSKIAAEFKKRAPFKEAKTFHKRGLLWWSAIRSFFTGAEPLITKDAVYKSDRFPIMDNSKIEKAFPHKYFSMEDTISWTCKELQSNIK